MTIKSEDITIESEFKKTASDATNMKCKSFAMESKLTKTGSRYIALPIRCSKLAIEL